MGTESRELLVMTLVWMKHLPPRVGDVHWHGGEEYRITGFLPAQRDDWFRKAITLTWFRKAITLTLETK